MSWNAADFDAQVVIPALQAIGLYSLAADQLVLGTAIQESHLLYIQQIGGGPALGYFQMEPATHDDIWANFLEYRHSLATLVASLLAPADLADRAAALKTNPKYAAAMCRVDYARKPAPLPAANDIAAMAAYWKNYYNTAGGGGSVAEFIVNWNLVTAPPADEN